MLAKAHDTKIWSAWHDQHYPFIFRYALSRLGNHQDAEDIASEVFLEAMKGIARFKYRGRPILAWFYGIAHHLVSRRRRETSRATRLVEKQANIQPQTTEFENASLESLTLQTALERLKPQHREVLVLRFLLELPTRRVAELIGKTEAATYSLQVRAIGSLRGKLPK